MKPLVHLINIFIWWCVPLVTIFLLSFLFMFSYKDAVQSTVFIFIYIWWCIILGGGYLASVADSDDSSLKFIKL